MSPAQGHTFEERVKRGLSGLLTHENSRIVVESLKSIGAVEGSHDRVLLVHFRLEGEWASPASFTFPFDESIPIGQSLEVMKDMVARNWQRAHLPPPSYSPPDQALQ